MKICSRCGSEHNTVGSWCNPCRAAAMREYRKTPAGKEATRRMEANRVITEDRKQKAKELAKKWAQKPESRERLRLADRKFKLANKEKLYAKERERRANNSKFKLAANLRRRLREIFAKKGYTKKSRSFEILGCDYQTFHDHIEAQFTEGMTWSNFGEWELDHIYPVAKATTELEVIALNHYTNIQPMWSFYNKLKQDMLPAEWEQYKTTHNIDVSVNPNKRSERGADCLSFSIATL